MTFDLLPRGQFGAILCDPPWRFKTYNEKGRNRCPDWRPFKWSPVRHYGTMDMDDLCAMPVADVAAKDCCLFLWICWPMLPDAMRLIEAWGFTYKTCAFAWVKAKDQLDMFSDGASIGCGYWTRSNSEVALLATRGKPKRLKADVRQAIITQRREHSRKPDEIYGRIERLVAGPYLEIFSRTERSGWTTWGNQVGKFGEAA